MARSAATAAQHLRRVIVFRVYWRSTLNLNCNLATQRKSPATAFFAGYRLTALGRDELLTGIRIPKQAGRSAFRKLGARRYLVISIAMVACVIDVDDAGRVVSAKIAVGACAATAQRLRSVEAAVIGRPLDAALVMPAHFADLEPIGDIRASRGLSASCGLRIDARCDCIFLPPPLEAKQSMADDIALSVTINGCLQRVCCAPFETLADLLRDRLHMTGTKIGCDAGDCGACTVLLDGEQVCACLVPAGQLMGRRVDTVEGAGPNGITEQLRHAFSQSRRSSMWDLYASDVDGGDIAVDARCDAITQKNRGGSRWRVVPLHRLHQDHRCGIGGGSKPRGATVSIGCTGNVTACRAETGTRRWVAKGHGDGCVWRGCSAD